MKHLHEHIKAFGTNFETACIAGLLAIITDMGWVLHDVLLNGVSISYILIGAGLSVAAYFTIAVIVRHNGTQVRKYLRRKS